MGQDHRVPNSQLDLINRRLEHLAEQHKKFRSAARSPTMPIYDAAFPLDSVDGQHALRTQADPDTTDEPTTSGWYYRDGHWHLYAPGAFIYVGEPFSPDAGGGIVDFDNNPHPYAPGDSPGSIPFITGTNAFLEDADGNPGDGFRFRMVPHGLQIDCSGGLTGVADGDEITQLPFGPAKTKARVCALVDGSGAFMYTVRPSGIVTFIRAL